MTESVGAIEYVADVDVSGVLRGSKVIDKNVDLTKAKFKGLDTQVSKTAKGVKRGFSSMGRNAGQAGIQIQQLAGQVQAGTSPFVALSQQAADLGIVLGAPMLGVIASFGAILVSTLIPSLSDSEEKVGELIEKIKELKEESGITANQTKLLAQQNNEEAESIANRNQEIAEEIKRLEELQKLRTSAGTGTDEGEFAVPRTAQQNQERYAGAIEETRKRLVTLRAELDTNNQEIIKLAENSANLRDPVDEETIEKAKSLKQQLELTRVKIEEGDLAAAKLAARFQLGLTEAEKLPPEIEKSIEKIQRLKDEQQASVRATKEQAAAQRELNSVLDQVFENEKRQQEKDKNLLGTLGVSPEVQARQNTIDQLRELERLRREGDLQDEQDYINRRNEIVRQGNEALGNLNESVAGINWESFGNRAAGALTQVAVGAMDGKEAMRQLAQSILNEALGSLIKLGIQTIANAALGQSAQAGLAAAGAATAGSLLAAWTPAAAAASIATSGGAAAAGAAGVATAAPAIAGSIAATSAIGGGRLYGGPVAPGTLYPITEDGRPEILTQGNKQYLLPGKNGSVTSNRDMQGMGGQPVVNVTVNNLPGQTAQVSSRQNGNQTDIDVNIKATANNIRSGGEIFQAIQDTTKAGVRAG